MVRASSWETQQNFHTVSTPVVRTPAAASALKKIGATNVGLIVSTNPPNAALSDLLAQALPENYQLKVAELAKSSTADVRDFTPLLQSMKDKGGDAIVFVLGPSLFGALASAVSFPKAYIVMGAAVLLDGILRVFKRECRSDNRRAGPSDSLVLIFRDLAPKPQSDKLSDLC